MPISQCNLIAAVYAPIMHLLNVLHCVENEYLKLSELSGKGLSHTLELESAVRHAHGAKQSTITNLSRLKEMLKPFTIMHKPQFIDLEKSDAASLVEFLRQPGGFRDLQRVLMDLDEALLMLASSTHFQAPLYLKRGMNVREKICVQLKLLSSRTLNSLANHLGSKMDVETETLERKVARRHLLDTAVKLGGHVTQQSSEDKDPLITDTFMPGKWVYVQFRHLALKIRPLWTLIIERADATRLPIYIETAQHLQGIYAAFRTRLITEPFARQCEYLTQKQIYQSGPEGLSLGFGQACSFWLSVCQHEIDCHRAFFGELTTLEKTSLHTIISVLGDTFYERMRRYLVGDLESGCLREIFESIEMHFQNEDVTAGRRAEYKSLSYQPLWSLKKDLQEKILYLSLQLSSIESTPNYDDKHNYYPTILTDYILLHPIWDRQARMHPLTGQAVSHIERMSSTIDFLLVGPFASDICRVTLDRLRAAVKTTDMVDTSLFMLRQCLFLRFALTQTSHAHAQTRVADSPVTGRQNGFSEFISNDDGTQTTQSPHPMGGKRILNFGNVRNRVSEAWRAFLVPQESQERGTLRGILWALTPEVEEDEANPDAQIGIEIEKNVADLITLVSNRISVHLLVWAAQQQKNVRTSTHGVESADEAVTRFSEAMHSELTSFLHKISLYLHDRNIADTLDNVLMLQQQLFPSEKTSQKSHQSPRSRTFEDRDSLQSIPKPSGRYFAEEDSLDMILHPVRITLVENYRHFLQNTHQKSPGDDAQTGHDTHHSVEPRKDPSDNSVHERANLSNPSETMVEARSLPSLRSLDAQILSAYGTWSTMMIPKQIE